MDGEIIPRGVVLDRAKRALEAGQPLETSNPWAPGTAAGRMFTAEYLAARVLRQAEERRHPTEQEG
jgi:hypothetical protein